MAYELSNVEVEVLTEAFARHQSRGNLEISSLSIDLRIPNQEARAIVKGLIDKGLLEWRINPHWVGLSREGLVYAKDREAGSTAPKPAQQTINVNHISTLIGAQSGGQNVGTITGTNVAVGEGATINIQNFFNEMVKQVEANPEIPPEEKRGLVEKLKALAANPWVVTIGSQVLLSLLPS